jgi:hypothetical protein
MIPNACGGLFLGSLLVIADALVVIIWFVNASAFCVVAFRGARRARKLPFLCRILPELHFASAWREVFFWRERQGHDDELSVIRDSLLARESNPIPTHIGPHSTFKIGAPVG